MLAARPEDRPSAREVERHARAHRLARGAEAPSLLGWAEGAVPKVARRPGERLAAPRALTEQLSAPRPPEPPLTVGLPPPPDRPRVSLAPWVFVGACASLFVGGVALLVASPLRSEAAIAPVEVVVEAPPPAVAPVEAPPAPTPSAIAPTPTRRAAKVQVTATPGAEGVTLIRDGVRIALPATLAPGAYHATMSGWPAGALSPVVIDAPSAVYCDRALKRCRVERAQ